MTDCKWPYPRCCSLLLLFFYFTTPRLEEVHICSKALPTPNSACAGSLLPCRPHDPCRPHQTIIRNSNATIYVRLTVTGWKVDLRKWLSEGQLSVGSLRMLLHKVHVFLSPFITTHRCLTTDTFPVMDVPHGLTGSRRLSGGAC